MGKLKSIKSKMLWARVFKLAFYGIGFPLLFWFLREEKVALGSGYVLGNSGNMILYFGIAIWAVVGLAQLIAHAFKNRKARALFVSIVALAVTVGPLVFCDLYAEKQINALREKYKDSVPTFEKQVVEFHNYAHDLDRPIDDFLATYNIDYNYGSKGGNTDNSETKDVPEEGAIYSPNGLYADGYIFGYEAAKKVILTYYDARKTYAEQNQGADIEVALETELEELQTNPSSAWNQYKKTKEYQDAYGPDGTATKYYVTEERLNAIISELGKTLGSTTALNPVINALPGILQLLGANISLDINDLKAHLNENLDLDYLMNIVSGIAPTVTKDMLLDLLASYSFYQSPTTKPMFDFLEDKTLRDYAWAKYEGMTHGAKVGSILIPTVTENEEGEEEVSNVGCITLDSQGNKPMSEDQLRDLFTRVEIAQEYMPKLYPLISIRNMLVLYSGLAVFGVAAAYFFARIEQSQMKRLIEAASQGGIR